VTEPTGLEMLYPALDAATSAIRSAFDPAHTQGLAPRVTVLFPFLRETEVTASVQTRLSELIAAHTVFETGFLEVGRFPEALCLVPEPAAPFRQLTEAIARAFPGHSPCGGAFSDSVAQLTPARGPAVERSRMPSPTLPR